MKKEGKVDVISETIEQRTKSDKKQLRGKFTSGAIALLITLLAVVSATLQVTPPLKMKIVKKYRDILIGGNRFEKLKNREICGENCA